MRRTWPPSSRNRCQNCHRPKSAAPFSLLTYDDAPSLVDLDPRGRRGAPACRPGTPIPATATSRTIAACPPRERATLIAWVDQGTPLGDPKGIPESKSFPDGWAVGVPDVRLRKCPRNMSSRPRAWVRYQYFRIPLNLTEDRWVQSIECVPGDKAVVHHIIAFMVAKGRKDGVYLGGYAPGDLPSVYNPRNRQASARWLRDRVRGPLHARWARSARTARRSGLIFAKTPPRYEGITHAIENRRLVINPGDDNAEVKSRFTFESDSRLVSFMPHMHLRGKDFMYLVTYPGKEPEIVLSVPAYDLRMAERLPPVRAAVHAEGDGDRLCGPLRQLGQESREPRP